MTKKIIIAAAIGLLTANANAQNLNNQKTNVMKQEKNIFINPKELFNPIYNGFSHIGQVPAGTDLYFLSGQWASDENGKLVSTDFEEQVRKTLTNIKIALACAGMTTKNVVKQTIFIGEFTPEKKQILIKVASQEWGAEIFPASSIIPLPMLATTTGCLIEVEIIATK